MNKTNLITLILLLLIAVASIHARTSHLKRAANVTTAPEAIRFNIFDPATIQAADGEVCLIPVTQVARRIKKINVTLDADPGTEMDWDLKYADAFIGLANSVVVAVMDTTNGTASITSFTTATIPAAKCLYASFGAGPDAAATQACVMFYWE